MLRPNFYKKRVLIMGLGLLGGGLGVARFFARKGAILTVTDLRDKKELAPSLKKLKGYPIKYVLGKHCEKDFEKQDLIIRNPAVPSSSPFLEIARKLRIPIEMDVSLFLRFCPAEVIGITGTRGKTTVATLVYQVLKKKFHTLLGGNLRGKAALPLLEKLKRKSKVVLELSSWQLQGLKKSKISPHVAVVTNIYPDHLDRYKTMKDYIEDKKVIFKFQDKEDFLILNSENKLTKSFAKDAKSKVLFFKKGDWPKSWPLKIKGEHNRENVAAVLILAKIYNIDRQIIKKVVSNFKGVEHRLEEVRVLKGITFVNDTASTTPIAGVKAIKTYKGKPIILIAGGNSKNLDLTPFAKAILKYVKAVVLLEGTATDQLEKKVLTSRLKNLGRFKNFRKAILKAYQEAKKGDVVLLSPGCTSFSMFKNEFDRGEKFNAIVSSL